MSYLFALLAVLRDPAQSASLSESDWSGVVACARSANVLGTLAERVGTAGVRPGGRVSRHLDGARQLSARQRQSVVWELHCLDAALKDLGVPVVLLKGAAYVAGNYPNANGRLFGDIDILVPEAALGNVEVALMTNGWTTGKQNAYDQRYYRKWMHELPPMHHVRRGTVLDVHHTILPRTSRLRPDPQGLIARSTALPGFGALRIPSLEDLITHSLTHLVHEGEIGSTIRDLVDVDSLIGNGMATAGFGHRFAVRVAEHGLARPVGLGLALGTHYLGTNVPPEVIASCGLKGSVDANRPFMSRVYHHALRYWPDDKAGWKYKLATGFLYLRSHWLRMPPWLLVPHLARKAFLGVTTVMQNAPAADDALPR